MIKKIVVSLFFPFLSYSIVVSLITRKNIVFYSIVDPQKSLWFLWGAYVDATYYADGTGNRKATDKR